MKLAYHAYDVDGRAVRDVIDAASQDEATALLRKRGLFVAQLQQASGAQRSTTDPPRSSSRRRPRARAKNLAVLTRQFYILLSTGTPLIEAIEALSSQTRDPGWQAVMSDIAQRIERGSSLSEAMEHHPQCFDRVYRSLIAAGESSGKLTMIFDRLSQLTRKQLAMRTMVLGALVYPSVLLVVALGVTMLMGGGTSGRSMVLWAAHRSPSSVHGHPVFPAGGSGRSRTAGISMVSCIVATRRMGFTCEISR